MGRKRAGSRKQIYLCFAGLILLSIAACTFIKKPPDASSTVTKIVTTKEVEARKHLNLGKQFLARGDYGNALKENEKALSLLGKDPPAEEALFAVGLIHVHPANQAKNYDKSIASLKKLIKDHPKSPLVEQAKAIIGLLQENDRFSQTIDRLNNVIEELKEVDVRVEQKKREKAR